MLRVLGAGSCLRGGWEDTLLLGKIVPFRFGAGRVSKYLFNKEHLSTPAGLLGNGERGAGYPGLTESTVVLWAL